MNKTLRSRYLYFACSMLLCITIPWNLAFVSNLAIDRQVRADFELLQGKLREGSLADYSPLFIIFNANGKLNSARNRGGLVSQSESKSDVATLFQTIANIELSNGVTMDYLIHLKLVNLVDMTLLQITSQRNLKGWRWVKVNDWDIEQKISAEKF